MTPTLVLEAQPGGCLPGTLNCDCGTTALCIWEPNLGAACAGCGACYEPPIAPTPGRYTLKHGRPVMALIEGSKQ